MHGKRLELEALHGHAVRLGRRLGVPTPMAVGGVRGAGALRGGDALTSPLRARSGAISRRYRLRYLLGGACLLAATLSSLGIPWTVKQAIEALQGEGRRRRSAASP